MIGTVTARKYQNILENFIIPQIQQCQCLDSVTFIQDGALPHIELFVEQFFWQHITNDRVVTHAFESIWRPRLWGYLKNLVH